MKRLVAITVAATIVLLLVSLTQGKAPARRDPSAPLSAPATADAVDVARTYITALMGGDVKAAQAHSTLLLATQLASQPPHPGSFDQQPRVDLLTLSKAATSLDLAAELQWPDGRIAAFRVQLELHDGHWVVAGVQP
jgi:hypothetical protein